MPGTDCVFILFKYMLLNEYLKKPGNAITTFYIMCEWELGSVKYS